jgi:hypothetical protein
LGGEEFAGMAAPLAEFASCIKLSGCVACGISVDSVALISCEKNIMARKTTGAAATTTKKKDGLTKMEAVRRALAELGNDAMPARIKGFVKDRFDIEMTTDHISVYKGKILREAAAQAQNAAKKPLARKVARKKRRARRPLVQPSAATAKTAPVDNAVTMEDVSTIKGLLRRIGTSKVRQLVDLLAH